jgi:hypothetical protein
MILVLVNDDGSNTSSDDDMMIVPVHTNVIDTNNDNDNVKLAIHITFFNIL